MATTALSAPESLTEDGIFVSLTPDSLDITSVINRVRSPEAGAIVLFAGTTRSTFDSKPVHRLSYTSYAPLALRTLLSIAKHIKTTHSLLGIAMVHRLGEVPIGEESILVAVAAPHRKEAWRAGEEALELCKEKVEVWKLEEFEGGGAWRANRDGKAGVEIGQDADV